jgi:general secretion pathway protein G
MGAQILKHPAARGFTIVELAIVITVIGILVAVALPGYQRIILVAKEDVLREDLRVMRKMIDQYTADKEEAPSSLEDLVSAGYLPEIPVDPFTGEADWDVILEEQSVSLTGQRGIVDVKSRSDRTDSTGQQRYRDW